MDDPRDSNPAGDPPLSGTRRAGDLIFISGMVPVDENGLLYADTIEEQTERCIDLIEQELATHDASLADVVKTTVLLADPKRDWPVVNEIYARRFPDPKPARSAFGVTLAKDGFLVEIEGYAYKPQAR